MTGSRNQPLERPHLPIVYVRGYAGNDAEVDNTVADPYMGFNIGATVVRQDWEGAVHRHYFESPLVRLMKDHGYRDVYHVGDEMPLGEPLSPRSVFIYRYYDDVSNLLGAGQRRDIEDYAEGLGALILDIRARICEDGNFDPDTFRVYLVAHSMGGLVVRSFLQNPRPSVAKAAAMVDKVFTYATPHNGIDLQVLGNVPGIFSRNNADNFNRRRMAEYLGLPRDGSLDDVSSLAGHFDPDRFFCLVGTNARDYAGSGGWAQRVVGPISDGLVRISNAVVHGPWTRDGETTNTHAPRAFVYRSHSGHLGIVNSEDGYQNLTRFLFGDVRVDGVLLVKELSLPPRVQKAYDDGRQIKASYHFDVVIRVRRARWELHRRRTDENSAIFRKFDDLFPRPGSGGRVRHPHLFSTFLALWGRKSRGITLGFSVDLGVHVPEYEIDRRLFLDEYYPGGMLYRDKLNFEITPPRGEVEEWKLKWGSDRETPNRAEHRLEPIDAARVTEALPGFVEDDDLLFSVPVRQDTLPGIDAELVLRARPWG